MGRDMVATALLPMVPGSEQGWTSCPRQWDLWGVLGWALWEKPSSGGVGRGRCECGASLHPAAHCCFPTPETQQHLAWKQPSQPCLLRAHINLVFLCFILLSHFPECQRLGTQSVLQGNFLAAHSSKTQGGGEVGAKRE